MWLTKRHLAGSGASGGSSADCKLEIIVRLSLLSTPKTLDIWTDSRIHVSTGHRLLWLLYLFYLLHARCRAVFQNRLGFGRLLARTQSDRGLVSIGSRRSYALYCLSLRVHGCRSVFAGCQRIMAFSVLEWVSVPCECLVYWIQHVSRITSGRRSLTVDTKTNVERLDSQPGLDTAGRQRV